MRLIEALAVPWLDRQSEHHIPIDAAARAVAEAPKVWWCALEATAWGDSEPVCGGVHDGYKNECGWRALVDWEET